MKVEVWKIGATTEPVCASGIAPECTDRVEIPAGVVGSKRGELTADPFLH